MAGVSKNCNEPNLGSGGSSSQAYKRNVFQRTPPKCDNNNSRSGDDAPAQKSKKLFGVNLNEIFDSVELNIIVELLIFRFTALVVWTGSILYATYHVFLACEKHLGDWYKDPVMNPGIFSSIFKRGKDASDFEWEMFVAVAFGRLWFWYGLYAVTSRTLQPAFPKKWKIISFGLPILMFWELIGLIPTSFLFIQITIYWAIAKSQSRLLMWTVTLIFIYNLNEPLVQTFIPNDSFAEYFFVISSAWNCCRCISFCCDVWDKKIERDSINFIYLENLARFCLYLPLAISGPLITYNDFERCIINKDVEAVKRRDMASDFMNLLKTVLRLLLLAVFTESILHFLFFRSLAISYEFHHKLSLWAICGTIYWLGQFFAMKYKLLYGFPTCIAEFDGMEMPPLPTCPSYMHRYSAIWRDFDRGLYRFLVNYIYLPTLVWLKRQDKNKKVPLDVLKLGASFMTFAYVYVWHSLSFEVFVWTALNFLGITIERIGSAMKREVDKRTPVAPIHWDFIFEPIVTVPLAAMSILNSAIFCGNLNVARSFGYILWKRRQDNWVFLFLYFFTHTAVTHRTWRHKLHQLFSKILKH